MQNHPLALFVTRRIKGRLSEKRTYEKLELKYGSHPAFHVSTGPAVHERQRVDPASIPARAGIRSGIFGGTRRKPKMRKASKTKKIRKT